MKTYAVTVERTYTARHIHTRTVEAESEADAERIVAEALGDCAFDPSDEYEDAADHSGYDKAGPWHVESATETLPQVKP